MMDETSILKWLSISTFKDQTIPISFLQNIYANSEENSFIHNVTYALLYYMEREEQNVCDDCEMNCYTDETEEKTNVLSKFDYVRRIINHE